mmetsp:Transcript_58497/g.119646  ORF Transcript_58497/g.119646 Transcript_58497/m.119646 type:complete len:682 (+) Transcript_58497:61-2106(+)
MNPTPKPKTPDFMDPCKLTLHIAEVLKEFSARAEQQLSNTSDQDMIPVDLKEPFVIFMVTDRLFSVKGCELQFEEVGSQFQKVPTLVVKAITDALLRVAEPQMLSFEELSKEVSESQRDSLRELDNSSSTKKQTRKERMLLDAKVLSRKGLKLLTDAAIRAGHAMVDELFQPRYVPRPGSAGVLRQAAEVAKGLFSKFFSTEASQGFYRTNEDVGDRDTERWWGTRLKVDTVDNMAAEVTGFALHRKTESCTSTLLTHIKGSFASADGLIPALAVPSGHCDLGDNLLALQRRIAKSLDVWLERSKTLLASNIQGGAEQHEMPLVRVNLMQQVAIAVSVAHFAFVWASQATDRQGSVSTFLHENGREQKKAKYVPFKDLAHRVAAAMQPEGALSFDDLSNNVAKLRVRCKTHCNRLDPGDVERTLLDFVFLALQWIEDSSVAAVDAKHERVAELFCPGYEPRQLSRSHLKKAVGVAKQLWVDLTSAHERDTSHWTKDTGNSGALLQKLETLLPETNAIMFLEKQPPPVCVISSLLSRIPSRPGPSPPVPTVAAIPEPRPVTSDTPNVEGRQASMSAAPAPATPAAPAAPAFAAAPAVAAAPAAPAVQPVTAWDRAFAFIHQTDNPIVGGPQPALPATAATTTSSGAAPLAPVQGPASLSPPTSASNDPLKSDGFLKGFFGSV